VTLARALFYFLSEAAVSMRRSWKVGILAILTIATSLFMCGLFLLVTHNLAGLLSQWREQARVLIYFQPNTDSGEIARVRQAVAAHRGIGDVRAVSPQEARDRFEKIFPSLRGLVEGVGGGALPASLEIRLVGGPAAAKTRAWLKGLEQDSAVAMVDDDRDWLNQLEAVVVFLRGLGLLLGAVLLAAAVFTTASVIRLTLYLYRDEIAVMRLVGATEFYIRGPFYLSGLAEGLFGAALGLAGLYVAFVVIRPQVPVSVFSAVLEGGFLPPTQIGQLLALGAVAGLLGSIVSLRREKDASLRGE
jgi:cell division transport system permease protein